MTQIQIKKAYPSLREISEMKLPLSKAYKIFTILKTLEPQYQFSVDQERKLFEKHECTINNDGSVSFKDNERFGAFQESLLELNGFEVDVEIEPVVITDSDLKDQTISASMIYDLEGFVSFE